MSAEVLITSLNVQRIKVNAGKTISVLDLNRDLNFRLSRIYWINSDADPENNSAHAHKELEQVIFCLSGRVEIEISGIESNLKAVLYNDGTGIFVPKMHWKQIKYLEPSILLCLASNPYNEHDYIRDYNDFESALNL